MTNITIPLEELAQMVAEKIRPDVPFNMRYWDAGQCAAYFGKDRKYFTNHIATAPGFPDPKQPKTKTGRMHPMWKAMDVIKYVERK